MSEMKHYLALDMGAESGRAILGTIQSGKITLSEEHRFLTGAESVPTMYPDLVPSGLDSDCSMLWDFTRFWHEIKKSIHLAGKKVRIEAVGVDTWGVDFALLDKRGMMVGTPFNYRDSRTNGMMEEAFNRIPKEKIYELTGIQFMPINALYHLLAMSVRNDPQLSIADKFLMVPDLFNYWLSGKAVAEFTDTTTSQLFNPRKREWSKEIIQAMDFPRHIFPEVVAPGTILGPLRNSVALETGAQPLIIAPACHDTGAAVAAVPAEVDDFIWISSGTWSIVGMNTPEPIINEASYKYNFTNEGGLDGTYRFSKNVMGLWVVQQCRQQWINEGKEYSYTELTEWAKKADSLKSFVDPDYTAFLRPGKTAERVKEYCQITGQPIPQTEGEIIRAVLQGLALRYRYVIEKLEEVSERKMSTIHIVGGGTKNQLLSQLTADALGRRVITGPIEATGIGNLIVQAIANKDVGSWKEGVEIIRNSFEILTYEPGDKTPWDKSFELFKSNLDHVELAY